MQNFGQRKHGFERPEAIGDQMELPIDNEPPRAFRDTPANNARWAGMTSPGPMDSPSDYELARATGSNPIPATHDPYSGERLNEPHTHEYARMTRTYVGCTAAGCGATQTAPWCVLCNVPYWWQADTGWICPNVGTNHD